MVWDMDEAIKEVKLLGEHGEESSQKITELEALCKKLREDTPRLEEEKATLEGMVESRDELLMEIAKAIGLDHMGEDDEDEEEEEHANDGGDAAAPPATMPPPSVPLLPHLGDQWWRLGGDHPEHEAPAPHEVILADTEPEMPRLSLYHALMRGYEENLLRMEDDFDDLDVDPNEGRSDMDKWFPEDGNNDRDWVIKSKS
jgi:hypothetical protein